MLKKLLCLLLFVTIVIRSPVIHVFAEDGGTYQSKAGVGFTGEYEYPEESEGSGSGTGNPPGISGGGESSSKGGEGVVILPQTGDTANTQTVLLGVLIITSAFLLKYKRETQKLINIKK